MEAQRSRLATRVLQAALYATAREQRAECEQVVGAGGDDGQRVEVNAHDVVADFAEQLPGSEGLGDGIAADGVE